MAVIERKLIPLLLHVQLAICLSAEGLLVVPETVRVHVSETAHILCQYTGGDAQNVHLQWDILPSIHIKYPSMLNTTGIYLTMVIQSEETSIERHTCTARNMKNSSTQQASTQLIVCPSESLECKLLKTPNAFVFNLRCQYASLCHTTLRCAVNGQVLDYEGWISHSETVYSNISLTQSDVIDCYLYADTIETQLQTRVKISFESATVDEILTTLGVMTTNPPHQVSTEPNPTETSPKDCDIISNGSSVWMGLCIATWVLVVVPIALPKLAQFMRSRLPRNSNSASPETSI